MMGWRQGLMFNLLHRFGDPLFVPDERKNKEYAEWLRESGYQPPGEPEYQELLRLLEEEIASVREEFAYAEKANEERAAIEREACLAPEGETWSMMLRQEAALDRSIDRKVRILMRLRKEFTDLPSAAHGEGDGGRMENMEGVPDNDIMSYTSQGVEAGENSKMTERSGNVYENKGPAFSNPGQTGNCPQNKGSCALNAGMLLRTKEVCGMS
jgi:hypothetical protein